MKTVEGNPPRRAERYNNTRTGDLKPSPSHSFLEGNPRASIRNDRKPKGGGTGGQGAFNKLPPGSGGDLPDRFPNTEAPGEYTRDGSIMRAHQGRYLSARNIEFDGNLAELRQDQIVKTPKGEFQVVIIGGQRYFQKPFYF